MKLSNYSLNYPALFAAKQMDVFQFLSHCRQLGVEGASLHTRHLASTDADYLKKVRRAYLNEGLSVSQLTVSTNFGVAPERQEAELQRAREAVRIGLVLGAPLLRIFAGSPLNEADRQPA